jgi:predicted amidophosphoribosyltransferase
MRGAFMVRKTLAASHIAIIDDVMTTGHTSSELARTLKRAGAKQVDVWVLARAGSGQAR